MIGGSLLCGKPCTYSSGILTNAILLELAEIYCATGVEVRWLIWVRRNALAEVAGNSGDKECRFCDKAQRPSCDWSVPKAHK